MQKQSHISSLLGGNDALIIPQANEVGGGGILVSSWLSVRLAVRLRLWKSDICTIIPLTLDLHSCVDHDLRRTTTDFRVKRSKVKVTFGLQIFNSFYTITPFPFDPQ